MKHQPHANIERLQERQHEFAAQTAADDDDSVKQNNDSDSEEVSSKTDKALIAYLKHQSDARRQAIGELREKEKAHRTRVEALALEILGTAKKAREKDELEKKLGKLSMESTSTTADGKSKKDITKVLQTLQSEISLDTQAISAFRCVSCAQQCGRMCARTHERVKIYAILIVFCPCMCIVHVCLHTCSHARHRRFNGCSFFALI